MRAYEPRGPLDQHSRSKLEEPGIRPDRGASRRVCLLGRPPGVWSVVDRKDPSSLPTVVRGRVRVHRTCQRDHCIRMGAAEQDMCTRANGFDASTRSTYPDWPAAPCDDGYVHTSPVRAFAANDFGLFGTVGNVCQWTEDCFVEGGYAGAPTNGSARTVEGCQLRVIRGGSWLNSSRGLRAAIRDLARQGDRDTNVGFRIAREP